MFTARDNGLWIRVTKVAVCYSSVLLVQNIQHPFPRVPGESHALSCRSSETCPHHPGMGSLGHFCWSRNTLWRSNGDPVFQPPGRVVASGHQMRMGIYQFPSLFLGLNCMDLHGPVYIQAYQLFFGWNMLLSSSALLSQENIFIFPVIGLNQHMPQNKLKWKNVGRNVSVYFPTCEFSCGIEDLLCNPVPWFPLLVEVWNMGCAGGCSSVRSGFVVFSCQTAEGPVYTLTKLWVSSVYEVNKNSN